MKFSQHLTIEKTVHAVMCTFAAASVANVTAYFISTNHHPIVALLMATALGTAVATTAIMLTMVDMVKQRNRYIAIGCMVLALVGISGFVQMQGYLLHGLSNLVSAAMGFGIVFSGECLTAIALSLYQAAERRRKIDEADSGLELKMAETFADTLDAIDTASSAKYLQRHVDSIVKHRADKLVRQYIPVQPAHVTPVQSSTDSVNTVQNGGDRRDKLLQLLSEHDTPDTLNKTQLAQTLGVSRPQLYRDIKSLEKSGRLSMNGVIKIS